MKSLYESILDDEDVLIGRLKKDSKNPFRLLRIKRDEAKTTNDWKREAEKIMSKVQLPSDSSYFIGHNFIKIARSSRYLLEISFENDSIFSPEDACCMLIDYTKYSFAGRKWEQDDFEFIEWFIARYEFKYIKNTSTKAQNLYYLNK